MNELNQQYNQLVKDLVTLRKMIIAKKKEIIDVVKLIKNKT